MDGDSETYKYNKGIKSFFRFVFLPMGFDVLMKYTMDYTNSYWITIGIFYCISALLFILYYFFRKKVIFIIRIFFLPFIYDIVFKMTMDHFNSYWIATQVFYCISAFFFLIFGISIYIESINKKRIII